MAYYRLYFLDASEHIKNADEINADNDDMAALVAERRANGRPFELWNHDRMVVRQWLTTVADD